MTEEQTTITPDQKTGLQRLAKDPWAYITVLLILILVAVFVLDISITVTTGRTAPQQQPTGSALDMYTY